ncbi:TonB-dependent siderophore receptor [Asticcacaulis sp. AND118]|uniref:TonB-dependent receptor plug domain-containing protein n=1 Tax=Asticcacaulis sp. AND118 TaxID=2840468 RepID=UPI001D000021|nr:TonB-dependent receptor [Asticcacaulis sp. AND118]UDF02628.1 TonB-dependent receptor [Asticcacaulis sp. AND118]
MFSKLNRQTRLAALLLTSSALSGAIVTTAVAADEVPAAPAEDAAANAAMTEVVVTGRLRFRDRAETENPTLIYDQEFFQKFEPVSVGEMLKRVPGITFTSDTLEFDGVSMRGLPPGYTTILINGRKAPGGEKDRSFFVDRIPAELVERIEIVRSPTADQPRSGMAGSLNIVLKDGAKLRGGLIKAGAVINDDGKVRPSLAAAYAGGDETNDWWIGVNHQGRRNPKKKYSWRYKAINDDFDDMEYQQDTRDGKDTSVNGEWKHSFEDGFIRLNGFFVNTDRDEDEISKTYGATNFTDFDEVEVQAERISQKTYALGVDGEFGLGIGKLEYDFGWNKYDEHTTTTVHVGEEEDLSDLELDDEETLDIVDQEYNGKVAYGFKGDGYKLKFGVSTSQKKRDGVADPLGAYKIEETNIDPFVRATFTPTRNLTLDLGLRYEMTEREVTGEDDSGSYDESILTPSFNLLYKTSRDDQFRFSVARTSRSPDFDDMVPLTETEEPADENAFRGNASLKNETSWGADAGYEHRLGTQGIFGVNLFYRNIEDMIEVISTGETVEDDGDEFSVYQPRNIGEGKTWGVELDFSTPLDNLGVKNTGVYFNYTWMDSEVSDPFTGEKRKFNNQPDWVYNAGFVTNLPAWDVSFGSSIYGRDTGVAYAVDEVASVDYDPSLEAFVEKRFGKRYVLRFSVQNILDSEKAEVFTKYDGDSIDEILENRLNHEIDEYERESEKSGPLYQITLRATF